MRREQEIYVDRQKNIKLFMRIYEKLLVLGLGRVPCMAAGRRCFLLDFLCFHYNLIKMGEEEFHIHCHQFLNILQPLVTMFSRTKNLTIICCKSRIQFIFLVQERTGAVY
ncbi:hypothetical protein ACJX0J_036723, partial [Zea mays]